MSEREDGRGAFGNASSYRLRAQDLQPPEASPWLDNHSALSQQDIEQSITRRFEHIAEIHAELPALKTSRHQLTYRELNCRANEIARLILDRCGEGNEPIGLMVQHESAPLGILGILKAGKAYVPLDPSYPEERSAFMLSDTEARLLVTDRETYSLAKSLGFDDSRHINLDNQDVTVSSNNLTFAASPEDLAYILYSSGSTGQPKGVMHRHRNVLHTIMKYSKVLEIGPSDRLSLLPSCSTSASVSDIFSALLNGALLKPYNIRDRGLSNLGEWLAQEQITICHSIPSVFRQLARNFKSGDQLPSLRFYKLGGEPTYRSDVDIFQERFSRGCQLYVAYGCTEIHNLCYFFIDRDTKLAGELVPVGKSFEGADISITDDDGATVDYDCVGEIVVTSQYLSPGYWHRPNLSADAFATASDNPTTRVYRTGDLGRIREDGCLEVLGRKDFQVKIRGYRVEPGEIESILRRQPEVDDVVVIAQEDALGDRQLVAYFTQAHSQVDAAELRLKLKSQLPDYMVPAVCQRLDRFPLLPSGKVDRHALPKPDRLQAEVSSNFVAPRSPMEELIAKIWADVLNVERVGVHDNFFDLFGHSLLATVLMSRIHDECRVDLPLRSLFDYPTVSELADYILTVRNRPPSEKIPPIEPVPRSRELPLSYSEERMWFLHHLQEDAAAYNVATLYRLAGYLDVAALERSFNEVLKRHEILRTSYTTDNGRPVRFIAPSLSIDLPVVDLEFTTQKERDQEIQRYATEQAKCSFDLSRPPLLRIALLRENEASHFLLITMHHIVTDIWSMGIFMREWLTLLLDSGQKENPSLPDLRIQYADFANWQRSYIKTDWLESQLKYWKRKLSGASLVLELPTDYPRPAEQTFRGAHEKLELSQHLSDRLGRFCEAEGVTRFMALLTVFNVLLYRYTSQTDIIVGFPIANRHRSAVENLIGTFVNTLVVRADLSGNPTMKELLTQVRESTLDAYDNQDLPFEQLVDALQPNRDLSRSPVFQVMFTHQEIPVPLPKPADLKLTRLTVDRKAAQFDMTMSVRATPEKSNLVNVEYNTDLFEKRTIVRLLQHFRNLVESFVSDPNQRLYDISPLSQDECQQILQTWNQTAQSFPSDVGVSQLFESQVERTPEKVAVVCGGERASYRELNDRADCVAQALQRLGVGPGIMVGICAERSIDLISGLLGILKSGGAYVPLDPNYPTARLAHIVEDANLSVLLTQSHLQDRLPEFRGQSIFFEHLSDTGDSDRNILPMRPAGLAYIIYTSGSTGKPKGVMISMKALVNLLFAFKEELNLEESDVLLAVTTISFDIAGLELFLPLIVGAQLDLVDRDTAVDAISLKNKLNSSNASVMQATPATWQMLVDADWTGTSGLKILCGGEAMPRELADHLMTRGSAVFNVYGPTETTIWSMLYKVPAGYTKNIVPIGRPIANTQIYILDNQLQPVPIGASGDLYIGGAGLAEGYHNQPGLTSERFIPNPFSDSSHSLLYKTGDLARYRADGTVEFQGRVDHQVKLRGFRIELGEIESVLLAHPSIRQAAAIVRSDSNNSARLIAYIVVVGEKTFEDRALREYLREFLPDYMVPAVFVKIDKMPLGPSGKVDRDALPEVEQITCDGEEDSIVAPSNNLESSLLPIWESVLDMRPVSVTDSFFELGGHSLTAFRLISEIKSSLGLTVALRDIFNSPSIRELSGVLEINQKT